MSARLAVRNWKETNEMVWGYRTSPSEREQMSELVLGPGLVIPSELEPARRHELKRVYRLTRRKQCTE